MGSAPHHCSPAPKSATPPGSRSSGSRGHGAGQNITKAGQRGGVHAAPRQERRRMPAKAQVSPSEVWFEKASTSTPKEETLNSSWGHVAIQNPQALPLRVTNASSGQPDTASLGGRAWPPPQPWESPAPVHWHLRATAAAQGVTAACQHLRLQNGKVRESPLQPHTRPCRG